MTVLDRPNEYAEPGELQNLGARPRRSLDQNRLMWALLSDVSRQVIWHGLKLEPEDWKHVFTSALKRHRIVPGIDGGFVVLGMSTSRMTKQELSELVELIYAFGAQQDVRFQTDAQADSCATT